MNRTRRLFFALWPNAEVRDRIERADYPRLKPGTTPAENWHITLFFLGPTSHQQQTAIQQAATRVRSSPFQLDLDITGQFRRAGVVWLGCQHPPPELMKFQSGLEATLRSACPQHPAFLSPSRPYRPHLTLYRNLRQVQAAQRIAPIQWLVNTFCLIESRPGMQPIYQVLNQWDLNPAIDFLSP